MKTIIAFLNFSRPLSVVILSLLTFIVIFPTTNSLMRETNFRIAIADACTVEFLLVLAPLYLSSIVIMMICKREISAREILLECLIASVLYLPLAAFESANFESYLSLTGAGSSAILSGLIFNPILFLIVFTPLPLTCFLVAWMRRRLQKQAR